ncbi:hypothetical protein ACLQ24_30335, partial [Micromonospora sp. DT4]|uniref:hypothetical protein n=1 Tax=Micromonospora sp. DT4 TaxID=3393438 RepID=UPI003CE907EE
MGEPVVYPSDGIAAAAEPDVLAHSDSEQRSGDVENAEATAGVGVARWGSRVVPFPGQGGAAVVLPVEHAAGSAGAVIGKTLRAASDAESVAALRLRRAVQGLPRWDSQTADCVFRVGAVLT